MSVSRRDKRLAFRNTILLFLFNQVWTQPDTVGEARVTRSPFGSDGINLINKHNRGSMLIRDPKEFTDKLGTLARVPIEKESKSKPQTTPTFPDNG